MVIQCHGRNTFYKNKYFLFDINLKILIVLDKTKTLPMFIDFTSNKATHMGDLNNLVYYLEDIILLLTGNIICLKL